MKLRTYQAYKMAEALAAVRHDLGTNAVILSTRTFKRGGLLGLGRKTIVEVTATIPDSLQLTKPKPTAPNRARALAARKGYETQSASSAHTTDREKTRELAKSIALNHSTEQSKPQSEISDTRMTKKEDPPVIKQEKLPAARRFILASPENFAPMSGNAIIEAEAKPGGVMPGAMEEELTAIRTMVGRVLRKQAATSLPAHHMPEQLFRMYLKLISQDVSDELAESIMNDVRDQVGPHQLNDEEHVSTVVCDHLAKLIPVADHPLPSESPDDRPLTIALIGPTGSGKTTTLAKIAASLKIHQNKRVGLVTADTYRIAAVEQLRTYAEIVGIPLQVAGTPEEIPHALETLSDCDVILFDTAGRSQNDSVRIDDLRAFIRAARPHETHLVLSSTAGERVLLKEAEAFSAVGIDKIVLTKLDEAVTFGVLINVLNTLGKKVSYLTMGQEVPDDLEVGRPERLAKLILEGSTNT